MLGAILFRCLFFAVLFFFFKQKTAYEMRISDWSSDVCSSDLLIETFERKPAEQADAIVEITHRREKCLFLVAPFNRCRVLDPPMRRHRAAGPDRTGLAGGIVANGENEIEFRGIRTSELRSEEHTSELQSLMRISYAVFCL